MLENSEAIVAVHEGNPLYVELPANVPLRITYTEPGLQGDRSSAGSKPATLETGISIQVPLFIKQDEVVLVDTRTGEVSTRSKARKAALDLLYESDIRKTQAGVLMQSRITELEYVIRDFTKELVDGVEHNRRKIDELIATYSQGWDMDRMPVIDRNILRLAIFEILWSSDVPQAVAINEALELAQTLSTDESSKYINGVLSKVVEIKPDLVL
jgi:N utilization substance protein B